ncbi:MAG: uroporphyrinogen-III C-methyltransferase [Bacillota bacterium]
MQKKRGMVYLVGAGPGDPELITVRGLKCIARAEVLVYDRLASPGLLHHAPSRCELVYAGKGPGAHTLKQAEINAILLARAREGRIVTRLKGGDPFLFGRGGEEAEYLAEHGIPFEVVPGVTSALAVPAAAGIPVTHRAYTSSLAIITGHGDPRKHGMDGVAWDKLSTGAGTLVLLMGRANLAEITQKIMENGRSPRTPAALISRGTMPQQCTLCAPLGEIAAQAEQAVLPPPAILVIGEVVKLRQKLAWLEQKPLFGCRVVVTRPREQAAALADAIAELGGEPLVIPLITIAPPVDTAPLDRVIREISSYDWVIFTSVNGVKYFWERLRCLGRDIRGLKGARLCAIGPATCAALEGKGLRVDIVPSAYRAEGLLERLKDEIKPGEHVLLPRAAAARPLLPRALASLGARVTHVEAYRTLPGKGDVSLLRSLLRERDVQVITFTSPSTVRQCLVLLGSEAGELLQGVTLASIGPITTAAARSLGLEVDVEADEYTIDGLVKALLKWASDRTVCS